MSQEITLSTLEQVNPLVIFKKGGMSSILSAIRSEVLSDLPDTSTDKGRKEIAANAYKVAKSKVFLDTLGKQLADDLNAKLKPINAERKLARDTLDDLKCEVRQPLTEWEQDQAQIKAKAEAVEAAEKLAIQVGVDYEMAVLMDGEYNRQLAARIEADKKAKAAYEDQLKSQAAAQAKLEAETAAKALIEKAEADKKAAEQEAANQRVLAKLEKEKADSDRKLALEKAEADQALAVRHEKARQANEDAANKLAIEKREADRAHVGAIRKLAKENLMLIDGINEDLAKSIVMAISNGNVPNVTISY